MQTNAERKAAFDQKMSLLSAGRASLEAATFTPKDMRKADISVSEDGNRRSAFEILSFPNVTFSNLVKLEPSFASIDKVIQNQLSCDALYANYIERQNRDVEKMKRDEAHEIPDDFDYADLKGLSNELRSKLIAVRPQTIGQASRVEGMTPAACTLILARLRQENRKKVSNG